MSNKALSSILLVDDNFTMRVLLRGILRSEETANYIVVGEASDAESAMEQALRLRPDIIFLDIVMPKGNGLDLLRQIRTQLPQTVVLMVTSSHDSATVKAAVDGGASGYIVKPFNSSTILNEVKQAVEKSRALKADAVKSDDATTT
ncbi:MAG: response regulator [Sterolibacterium sp.]|nr:response regulator [Sterolibacterium sp.]